MIGKELLSTVLEIEVTTVRDEIKSKANMLHFETTDFGTNRVASPCVPSINIYELAHKCKVWADSKDYLLSSIINNGKSFSSVSHKKYPHKNICWTNITEYNTEPQAIIKACEYILENLKSETGE